MKNKKLTLKLFARLALTLVIVMLIFYFVLVFDWGKTNSNIEGATLSLDALVNRNSSVAMMSDNPQTINTALGLISRISELHDYVMNWFGIASASTVLVVDPFYATHFTGKGVDGFNLFYTLAAKYGQHAKIYVIQEPIDKNKYDINMGDLSGVVRVLKPQDFLLIKYTERVLVSPLLQVFAPRQYQAIQNIREASQRSFTRIVYDEEVSSESFLSLDYERAMRDLGMFGAELAQKKSAESPRLALVLDPSDINSLQRRVHQFLYALYQTNTNIAVSYYWLGADKNTRVENLLKSLSPETIMYIDAGPETYSATSNFIKENSTAPLLWKNRFLTFHYFNLEHLEYKLPVAGKVYVNQDFIFKKKNKINAKFYRILDD